MKPAVVIVGRGKTKKHIDWTRDDADYWAFNDHAMTLPRLDAMFEMHMDWQTTERYNVIGAEGYRDWLCQPHPFPVWMHKEEAAVPASRRYPLELAGRVFFTSTTPYAIALAIELGYERIELNGIEADKGTEYESARDAIFFWLGRAEGAGRQIILHPENQLFSAPLYWKAEK